jgi:hypothetical protein
LKKILIYNGASSSNSITCLRNKKKDRNHVILRNKDVQKTKKREKVKVIKVKKKNKNHGTIETLKRMLKNLERVEKVNQNSSNLSIPMNKVRIKTKAPSIHQVDRVIATLNKRAYSSAC